MLILESTSTFKSRKNILKLVYSIPRVHIVCNFTIQTFYHIVERRLDLDDYLPFLKETVRYCLEILDKDKNKKNDIYIIQYLFNIFVCTLYCTIFYRNVNFKNNSFH